jgi:hypothetical protein
MKIWGLIFWSNFDSNAQVRPYMGGHFFSPANPPEAEGRNNPPVITGG